MGTIDLNETQLLLEGFGFTNSTFDQFEKNSQLRGVESKSDRAFKFDQVAPFRQNIINLDKQVPKNNRLYYVVNLSGGRFMIRVWGWV